MTRHPKTIHLNTVFLKDCDEEGHEDIKRSLIENEAEKKTLLRSSDSKLERLDARFGQVIVLLERIATDQAKLLSTLASQVHPSYGPPPSIFPSSSFKCPLLSSKQRLAYNIIN